jgi:hypothetical protein
MRRTILLSLLLLVATSAFAGSGRIIIVNKDLPGVGLNDPTPVTPVGGNDGRTLGEQRLNVYQAAADRWSALLDTNVDIIADATFQSLDCDETTAVLGAAGPQTWRRNFARAPQADVWYPIALANALSGTDLAQGTADITMRFNADIDNAVCLGSASWYYGLDGNHGGNTDLFVVVLHELAHGLGVSSTSNGGTFFLDSPSVFDTHTFDIAAGLRWDQMSAGQREASLIRSGKLVWDGEHVRNYIGRFLGPVTTLTISAPSSIARDLDIGTATFGPAADRAAMSGNLVRALDAEGSPAGSTAFDGCTAFTNAAAISGNIALIDRGACPFVTKATNAQAAGATGVVIVDNVRTECASPVAMGTSAETENEASKITIPIVSILAADGDVLKAQLTGNATVSTLLRVDPSRRSGTVQQGYMRLYAPCSFEPGSTKHHWDTVASPNLLMEPAVNADVLHGVDLTLYQLLDIGWKEAPRSGRTVLRR